MADHKLAPLFGTGVSSCKTYDGLFAVIRESLACGIRGFDTAPSYGTEEILGKCLNLCLQKFGIDRNELFIQTKVDAWQMQEGKDKVRKHVLQTLKKMGFDYFDSLLIHWPVPEYFDETWDCFLDLQRDGYVKNIGVCNVRMRQLVQFEQGNIRPQIVQIERNPLNTCAQEVMFCNRHNITVQSYSPLCKMHRDIAESPLLNGLTEKYHKNIGQIVLRWHIDTGVTPVFTSTKAHRIREYSELNDFSLSQDEKDLINQMNRNYKMYLEACACPGF